MIQTTHVGSLPFLDIDSALEYTFKWDVPTLFTLPKLNKLELLGLETLRALGLNPAPNQSDINLPLDYFQRSNDLTPLHLDMFLRFGEKVDKLSKFKVQFTGPVTLYSLLKNKEQINFMELSQFLLEKFVRCSERLQKYGDIIFVLDEPLLRENLLFYEKSKYLEALKKTRAEVFIHCCDKLDLTQLSQSLTSMHLDIDLYNDDPKFPPLTLPFVGLDVKLSIPPSINGIKLFKESSLKYISPPCGLALAKIQYVNDLPDIYKDICR